MEQRLSPEFEQVFRNLRAAERLLHADSMSGESSDAKHSIEDALASFQAARDRLRALIKVRSESVRRRV